jgi:hypothetical protein
MVTVGRAMADHRDAIIHEWSDWLTKRVSSAAGLSRETIERELRLLLDVMIENVGPMRRSADEVWHHACEHYGLVGAARGLAAGEIVEEIQYLRGLLTRRLGPVLATLRPRQAMAMILRLNAILDKGVAVAVVGYTDALVATLFAQNGVPAPSNSLDSQDILKQLDQIEGELAVVVRHR